MTFTPDELRNVSVFIEVGARSVSSEKSLQESAAIQAIALQLLKKIHDAHAQPPQVAAPSPEPAPSPKVE